MNNTHNIDEVKPDEMPKGEIELLEKICLYKKVSFITFEDLTDLPQCKIIKIPVVFARGCKINTRLWYTICDITSKSCL